jgi:signal transduction histidine kinase
MIEVECRIQQRTGEWKWILLRTTLFDRFPDGSAKQLLGVALDVTESRRLREQLIQSSKLESLGKLAGGVAHDFNNLLTVIQSYAEMAQSALSDEHPAYSHVEQILKASEQASHLTNQMLAFARRRIISPRVFNLNELVREAETFLQRLLPENIQMKTVLEPNLWHVHADPAQIEQVLLNLAINARDAMPEGGVLTIETANVTLGEAYTARHAEVQAGEYVLLAVSDTGIGMDERTLARLFEPFFTTKEAGKGTGLGLATCYGIVKQAGGSIWVYSEPGKGTTFKVYLPRTLETAVGLPERPVRRRVIGGHETVLVVEDNDAVREVAVAALEAQGYRVLQAASGAEALQLVEDMEEPVHLLLTDVVMPGMSGAALAQQLQGAISTPESALHLRLHPERDCASRRAGGRHRFLTEAVSPRRPCPSRARGYWAPHSRRGLCRSPVTCGHRQSPVLTLRTARGSRTSILPSGSWTAGSSCHTLSSLSTRWWVRARLPMPVSRRLRSLPTKGACAR